jgi:kynurenine formamidase
VTDSTGRSARPRPSEDEVRGYLTSLSNWGRWGDGVDGIKGALNLITPDVVASAASLVQDGHTISCSIPFKFAPEGEGWDDSGHLVPGGSPYPVHYLTEKERMVDPKAGTRVSTHDGFLIQPHGQLITHLDAPCHTFMDGTFFNGVHIDGAFGENEALIGSIDLAAGGIVTRGVLLDIPRALGQDWLDNSDTVMPEDLDLAEKVQGVSVQPGDCLLVRTGYRVHSLYQLREGANYSRPGMQASTLPWLRERDVAVLGTDVPTDGMPHEYGSLGLPVHTVGMWAIGLWIIDNCLLEQLGEHCAATGRYEFQLAIAPLDLPGGTGSPVNPIAIF